MKPKAVYFLGSTFFNMVYSPQDRARISQLVHITDDLLTPQNWKDHLDAARQTEILFSGWGMTALTEELLSFFPKLKAVFYAGGSVKGIATEAMWDRGIVLSGAAAANAIPVAEFTLAQIILSTKHAWRVSASIREHKAYPHRYDPPGMFGSTIGIISLGLIGRMVVERLQAFDVSVVVYDPFVSDEEARRLGVELVSLEELFERSDVVSCHAPLLKETEGFLHRAHFASMKEGATFINTARGALVNEPDLIAVLRERPDLWALLDVTFPEPPKAGSPLYELPNVVLTPHYAGSMGRECFRMGQFMCDEASRFLSGQPLQHQITRERAMILA